MDDPPAPGGRGFRGCIVNVSSVSATVASVNRGDYCISKAGIAMATKLWAARLAEFGIEVYEVRPGIVATDMTAGVNAKIRQADRRRPDGAKTLGPAERCRQGRRHPGRGELPYATGQVLNIDGGLTLRRL
jgi:3-oxoacyl-[acyl-carrier protein] reductase